MYIHTQCCKVTWIEAIEVCELQHDAQIFGWYLYVVGELKWGNCAKIPMHFPFASNLGAWRPSVLYISTVDSWVSLNVKLQFLLKVL
jgi:hypothetical protein